MTLRISGSSIPVYDDLIRRIRAQKVGRFPRRDDSPGVSIGRNKLQTKELRVLNAATDNPYVMPFKDRWPVPAAVQVFQSAPVSPVYTPDMETGGYMKRQVDQFMGQLNDLLARYEGRYVAFEDGQVLATGDTIRQVLNQVNARRGEVRPILVRRVQREYPPIEM